MIRKAEVNDLAVISSLAALLWPEHTVQELMEEFSEALAEENIQLFLKFVEGEPIGFAQCQLRSDYV